MVILISKSSCMLTLHLRHLSACWLVNVSYATKKVGCYTHPLAHRGKGESKTKNSNVALCIYSTRLGSSPVKVPSHFILPKTKVLLQ